ncbi:exoskeleton protein RP43-like isoform X2 [Panulirus ornatus]|uniref:exoskeleton protein RP43-like isoform X2 n=1 Tax=Panulirus ornatus TaxID=150431 RepID=UPI003A8B116C
MRKHDVICLLVLLLPILFVPINASILPKLKPRQDEPSNPKETIKNQHPHSGKILGESSATVDGDTYADNSCAYSQDTLGPAFGNISVGSADSNYQNNQDCEWQLLTPPETIIEVTWQTFDLEDSFSCIWDYVEVQDLSCSDASLEKYRYCGSKLPPVFISSSNMLVIRFHSDSSRTKPGFSLHYVSHPVLESASGNISVGSVDANYQNNLDQEWRLLTPRGTVVEVTWQTFDLEFSFQCVYDYVEIQDLSCSGVVLETYKYCGRSLPPTFTSSSSMLVIRFHSDSSVTEPGFSLLYTSYTVLEAVSGNISIGSDDSNYQNNQDHEWRLLTLPGTVMEITWQTFEIEFSFECIYDYVEMQDLSSSGVVVETYKYCGSRLPPVFTSSSNMLVIKFHSDSSVNRPGFSLHYTSYTVLESASGNISIGSADTNYQNNQDQEWRLLTPPGTVIRVTWHTFALEFSFQCIYDYVEIQDLSSSGVLVEKYKYCGSSLPPAFTSSSNMLVIRFHSDSSMTKPGFFLHYNSDTGPSLPGTTVDWTSSLPSTLTTAPPPSSCNGLQVLESAYGDIIIGSADTNYQNNLDCEWRLLAPPGTVVQVSWSTIDVESCGFSCVCDFVEIQDFSSSGVALEQ